MSAATVEDAATEIVRVLRATFMDSSGQSDLVLARLFQTVRTNDLDQELQGYLRRQTEPGQPVPERCLALLGTAGDVPQWCDRRTSRDHQAIALTSPEALFNVPMVSALVKSLGVELGTFLHGEHPVDTEELGVFHVAHAEDSPEVPGQAFVREHGVKSVIGFGGVLPGGEVFSVILFSRVQVPAEVAQLFRTVAVAAKLGLLSALERPLLRGLPARPADAGEVAALRIRALEQMLTVQQQTVDAQAANLEAALEQAIQARAEAEREAEANDALREVTTLLSAELDLDGLVQAATDAATRITGAKFGAFFYNVFRDDGEQYMLYTLSGADRSDFEGFPQPRATEVFAPTFSGERILRSDDITSDPRYGRNSPYRGMPKGHLPVRSYLAVPVVSRSGEVLGGFFFAHPDVGVFDERAERLATGIATQAAIGLDNVRLYQLERNTALTLQQSLLPQGISTREGIALAYEYLPGGGGMDVGGDWFDVISLPGGRIAFVIGDVMGRGVRAAAIMGQLRTAIRAYAVSDLSPDLLMNRLGQLVADMDDDLIATCTYAVLDQSQELLTLASAGHLPTALVHPGGEISLLDRPLGPPLGVPEAVHLEHQVPFPAGSRMVLFTDGLVEHRGRSLGEGLDALVTHLSDSGGAPDAVCHGLLSALLRETTQDDDVSMLVVENTGLDRRQQAVVEFPPDPATALAARRFVRSVLGEWDDAEHAEQIVIAVNEIYINAVTHARSDLILRMRRLPNLIVVEVEDFDGHLPKRMHSMPDDEGHRGLNIVASLASRWGSRITRSGKVVWAEFTVDHMPAEPAPFA